MSDRRYSTARWQRVRKVILHRDGYQCMVRGPRCRGTATTVHHKIPSSQAPELFWVEENLEASCGPCNYGGGSAIAGANRRAASERIAQLEQETLRLQEIIVVQENRIEELALALERHRPATEPARTRARPAIR